jgi:hypothetical protein
VAILQSRLPSKEAIIDAGAVPGTVPKSKVRIVRTFEQLFYYSVGYKS